MLATYTSNFLTMQRGIFSGCFSVGQNVKERTTKII